MEHFTSPEEEWSILVSYFPLFEIFFFSIGILHGFRGFPSMQFFPSLKEKWKFFTYRPVFGVPLSIRRLNLPGAFFSWNEVPFYRNNLRFLIFFKSWGAHCGGNCILVPYTWKNVFDLDYSDLTGSGNKEYIVARLDWLRPVGCTMFCSASHSFTVGFDRSTFEIAVYTCTLSSTILAVSISLNVNGQKGVCLFVERYTKFW